MEVSGSPYEVNPPDSLPVPRPYFGNSSFALTLNDKERGIDIPFSGLSSGERVIISMSTWEYVAALSGETPQLLLLDEPDAHLHPSLTRRFLSVIQRVFVEERDGRVIMTTHSPSTVALAPEGSLFEMRRSGPKRIVTVVNKQSLISVLTDGFIVVQEATQTVFLEGRTDPGFFSTTWDLLADQHDASRPATLEPYPNLLFAYGKGKTVIQEMVPQLRAKGLTNFFGIIDRDVENSPGDGVRVLRRYSMENYLLDPLCVWFVLHMEGHAYHLDPAG